MEDVYGEDGVKRKSGPVEEIIGQLALNNRLDGVPIPVDAKAKGGGRVKGLGRRSRMAYGEKVALLSLRAGPIASPAIRDARGVGLVVKVLVVASLSTSEVSARGRGLSDVRQAVVRSEKAEEGRPTTSCQVGHGRVGPT